MMATRARGNRVECGQISVAMPALGIFLLFVPGIAHTESHRLEFEKEIGIGWQAGRYGWMSFVSFNRDGTMVASDGPTAPDDVSGNLTLWSFPEGRLIKRVPVRPTAISNDGASALISLGASVFAVIAFSPDSRYNAESSSRQGIQDSHIRVVELASGRRVSAFGRHAAFAIAMSPDGMTLASGHWSIVTLWNMFTGKRLAELRGFGRYVKGLSFSRDGKLLAAGTDAGGLQIWDVGRLSRLASLDIEGGEVPNSVPMGGWSP